MADFRGQTAVYFFEHTVEYLIVDKTVAFHDLCNAVAGLHEVRINMGKRTMLTYSKKVNPMFFLKKRQKYSGLSAKRSEISERESGSI